MNEKDIEYLRDLKYFHQEKGDMTQFSDFDVEKLKQLDPFLYELRFKYILAKNMLDVYIKNNIK
jgi:hypothetical protein